MKWFKLLKAGTFETAGKDGTKKTVEITSADLDTVVKNYDPASFAAAFTIGHPQSQTAPAFGFVAALKRAGDAILFAPGKMVAEFARAVNDGLFPRISAGLEKTENGWSLNHIAFLGAWKPAVPGLGMVEFSASAPEILDTAELAEWRDAAAEFAKSDALNWIEGRLAAIGRMFTKMREYLIEKDGVELADNFFAGYDIDYIGSPAPDYVEAKDAAQFAQPAQPDYKALLTVAEDNKNRLAAALQEATGRIAVYEQKSRDAFLGTARAEFAGYVDAQIDARRVLPAEKQFLVDTLMALSKAETAKGDDLALLATPEVAAYKQQVELRPPHNLTREVADKGAAPAGVMSAVELAGHAVTYVLEQKTAGNKVSYADAVGYVRAHPEKFTTEKQ